MKKVPEFRPPPSMPAEARFLALGLDKEELFSLRSICSSEGWILDEARTLQDAVARLGGVAVVLCQYDPEGHWKKLLDAASRLTAPPYVIVWSRVADNFLWAEVLNLSGYDVLATPFRPVEVVHAVSGAIRRWRERAAGVSRLRSLAPAV